MNRWTKLRINSFVWAFCYQCRNDLHQAPQFPLLGLEFYSHQRKMVPQYSKFLNYAVANCKTLSLFDCAHRTLMCCSPMATDAEWDYAVYLLEKYYDDPSLRH